MKTRKVKARLKQLLRRESEATIHSIEYISSIIDAAHSRGDDMDTNMYDMHADLVLLLFKINGTYNNIAYLSKYECIREYIYFRKRGYLAAQ